MGLIHPTCDPSVHFAHSEDDIRATEGVPGFVITQSRRFIPCFGWHQATDKVIDGLVYELYGLSDEEIDVVERSEG